MNSKLKFPKSDRTDLGLVQQFLVFQLYLPMSGKFTIEAGITDTSNVSPNTRHLTPGHSHNCVDQKKIELHHQYQEGSEEVLPCDDPAAETQERKVDEP